MSTAPVEEELVTATRVAVGRALTAGEVAAADSVVQIILSTQEVKADEECQSIVDAGKVCALAEKTLKAQLESITRPANESIQAARALAAPRLDLFDRGKKAALSLYQGFTTKKRLAAQAAKAEAERIERAAAAAREAEAQVSVECGFDGDLPPEASSYVPPTAPLVRGGIGGMTMVTTKKYRVTNLIVAITHNEDLFKIELRHNDTKAALERARRLDPDATLVGIEEYEDESPRMA